MTTVMIDRSQFLRSREWARVDSEAREIVLGAVTSRPVRVGQLARDLGLEVKSATLPSGISGEIRKSSTAPSGYKIKVNRHEVKPRQRFTIAHEIGHYLLHRDEIGDGISDTVLYRSSLSSSIEAEANRVAADILMPFSLVWRDWDQCASHSDEDKISILSEMYDVSEIAMRVRLGLER
ncbi:hypothetical protein MACH10_10600 [Thalassospira tepidiphila]|nr:hypothetical protein MACH10_10600 [Thalassospira tepidiphila]